MWWRVRVLRILAPGAGRTESGWWACWARSSDGVCGILTLAATAFEGVGHGAPGYVETVEPGLQEQAKGQEPSTRGWVSEIRALLAPVLGWLPAYGRLAVALWRDPALPRGRKALLVGGLAYSPSAVDLLPGFVPGVGQLDGLLALLYALPWAGWRGRACGAVSGRPSWGCGRGTRRGMTRGGARREGCVAAEPGLPPDEQVQPHPERTFKWTADTGANGECGIWAETREASRQARRRSLLFCRAGGS